MGPRRSKLNIYISLWHWAFKPCVFLDSVDMLRAKLVNRGRYFLVISFHPELLFERLYRNILNVITFGLIFLRWGCFSLEPEPCFQHNLIIYCSSVPRFGRFLCCDYSLLAWSCYYVVFAILLTFLKNVILHVEFIRGEKIKLKRLLFVHLFNAPLRIEKRDLCDWLTVLWRDKC